MPLTKEERIDIILLAGNGTTRHVALTSNATHRTQIRHDIVTIFNHEIQKVARSGRPKTATDEGTSTQVRAAMARSPSKGTRCANGNQPKQCYGHFAILTSGIHTSCRCCNT
ncbi:hypothetical protein AVEN_157537-1 [Araneus ventricosus]|uniref:DUF4817 domain-containing protein n=1 Tax=Araneus ventricosus TaxID=182803 RepID=A0A4Y2I581_ARAVE|nr:hypothetical protein AVEN_157537-1 [Araneus ventricosus]